jgi:hypothetical protein
MLFAQDPNAALYIATVPASRLNAANHALIQLKIQLQTGEPTDLVVETVGGHQHCTTTDPTAKLSTTVFHIFARHPRDLATKPHSTDGYALVTGALNRGIEPAPTC